MKKILEPGKNCMGIYPVRKCGLLVDGRDYYRAFYEAAKMAKRYILIAGWQFDRDVRLLRGKEAQEENEPGLLSFLDNLCRENPDLDIYMLAWDFAELYLIDREWFQDWVYNWTTSERLHFRFDDRHAVGASHHEKYVVIDGNLAFLGGMDICEERWDDPRHLLNNPERKNSKGEPYEPYHDTQSFLMGDVARELTSLFTKRWENSGGGVLDLPPPVAEYGREISTTFSLSADKAAISRTRARTIVPKQESVREIRSLYLDAIDAAEEFIYIENQYFSSEAIYRALTNRFRSKERSRLEVVMVFPRSQHAFIEALSMGLAQGKMLESLKETASKGGHSLGVYYSLSQPPEEDVSVYIHSKLMVVDDRFMTVGSANTTNRSMGLDTEINVSWEESAEGQDDLVRSIRSARTSLIKEHAGLKDEDEVDAETVRGLVQRLDEIAGSGRYRLRLHTAETIIDEEMLPKDFNIEDLKLDPEVPVVEESVFELMSHDQTGVFSQGITVLSELLTHRESGTMMRLLRKAWTRRWLIGSIIMAVAIALWLAFK